MNEMPHASVRIACTGAMLLPIDELNDFQGNLKDLREENYVKLRKEILDLGFSEPVSVWAKPFGDGVGNKFSWMLLNGHQRLRTLRKMRNEGFTIPPIPVVVVEADDEKQAKRKVLALTSSFGEMTRQGLYEFSMDAGIGIEELESSFRFPEINLGKFGDEFFREVSFIAKDGGDKAPEPVVHRCPNCSNVIECTK